MLLCDQLHHLLEVPVECRELVGVVVRAPLDLSDEDWLHILDESTQGEVLEFFETLVVWALDDFFKYFEALVREAADDEHLQEVVDKDMHFVEFTEGVVVDGDGDSQQKEIPHVELADFWVIGEILVDLELIVAVPGERLIV